MTFESLPVLLRNRRPSRWTLLERVQRDGPLSINELARRLGADFPDKRDRYSVTELAAKTGRDPCAVRRDVDLLESVGMVRTVKEPNPGHGAPRVVSAAAGRFWMEEVEEASSNERASARTIG